jgi:hypothetical protein
MTKPVGKEVLNQYGITGWKRKRLSKGLRKHRRMQKAQDRHDAFSRAQERLRRQDELAKLPNYDDFLQSVQRGYRGACCPHCFTAKYISTPTKVKTKQGTKTLHHCDNCQKLYR